MQSLAIIMSHYIAIGPTDLQTNLDTRLPSSSDEFRPFSGLWCVQQSPYVRTEGDDWIDLKMSRWTHYGAEAYITFGNAPMNPFVSWPRIVKSASGYFLNVHILEFTSKLVNVFHGLLDSSSDLPFIWFNLQRLTCILQYFVSCYRLLQII